MTNKSLTVTVALVALATIVAITLAASAFSSLSDQADKNRAQAVTNKVQIAFLCKTSATIATVLDQAADGVDRQLRDGTYARLLKQGIITDNDIVQLKKNRDQYRAQVASLRSPDSPCVR